MKTITDALQHARLFIVDKTGYHQSEAEERADIGKEIDEALASIEQASQRIAQLETYISDNLHKKAICDCGDSIEPDTGAVCGTCASIEQASQPQGTPSSRWAEAGEPDPHDNHYNCERAELTLGHLTDDELANAAFMNYDRWPRLEDIIAGKAHPPIAYMTAVKDRIRWLSRKLAEATKSA